MLYERDLKQAAINLKQEMTRGDRVPAKCSEEEDQKRLMGVIEEKLVNATWVLRRMPDRERGFLKMRGALWPEMQNEAGRYPRASMSSFEARWKTRISAAEVDAMQPMLDLLLLLPDVSDRHLIFWAAWHQDGEVQTRVPWAKVRRSMGVNLSRWTFKRRYEAALTWLAALIILQ